MRKIFKGIGLLLGLILIILAGLAIYVSSSSRPTFEAEFPVTERQVATDSATLAHGEALVIQNCAGCHRGTEQTALAGRVFDDVAATETFGEIYIPNITQHPEHGIADYTAGELYRLLRTGVKRNGEVILPVMPTFVTMAESDVDAIIAFLQSDHPAVRAEAKENGTYQPSFLAKALLRFAFKPQPLREQYAATPPDGNDPVALGEYLVNDGLGCFYCHSGGLDVWDLDEPTNTPGYLGGGTVFHFSDHEVTAPRILPDSLAEISNWSENEFIAALKHNRRPGKPEFREPMHPYPYLDSSEVRAIYRYLHSRVEQGK